MDFFAILLLVIAVALVAARQSPLSLMDWARREWKLMWQPDWMPTPTAPEIEVGTVKDPRVANMIVKQRALGRRMRREGRSLFGGKEYRPVLTKAQPAPMPPKAAKVYPIRRTHTR